MQRRNRIDQFTPAEKAIYDAVQAVEAAGADVRLTDAVVLLQAARERVADFVDNTPSRELPATPTRPAGPYPGYVSDSELRRGGYSRED
jgi:hypothetical protein